MSERKEEDGSTISLSNMTGTMFQLLWVFLAAFSTIVLSAVLAFLIGCRYVAHRKRQDRRRQHGQQHIQNGLSPPLIVGFFHPYCSSGGGGERVLWKIVQVLLHQSLEQHEEGKSYPKPENGTKGTIHVLIYTIDPPTPTYRQGLCIERVLAIFRSHVMLGLVVLIVSLPIFLPTCRCFETCQGSFCH